MMPLAQTPLRRRAAVVLLYLARLCLGIAVSFGGPVVGAMAGPRAGYAVSCTAAVVMVLLTSTTVVDLLWLTGLLSLALWMFAADTMGDTRCGTVGPHPPSCDGYVRASAVLAALFIGSAAARLKPKHLDVVWGCRPAGLAQLPVTV